MVQSFFTPVQSYSPAMSAPGPYREWKPHAALQDYIYCYWFMPGCNLQDPAAGAAERIVPDGCIDLVFQISRDFTAIKSMIIGTLERSILVDMEHERLQSFGIRFYPGGLQPFLREPASPGLV